MPGVDKIRCKPAFRTVQVSFRTVTCRLCTMSHRTVTCLLCTMSHLCCYLINRSVNVHVIAHFQYLEQEGAIALLQCWQDLDSFEQLVTTSGGDPTQLQSDAMVLYDK